MITVPVDSLPMVTTALWLIMAENPIRLHPYQYNVKTRPTDPDRALYNKRSYTDPEGVHRGHWVFPVRGRPLSVVVGSEFPS